MTKKEGTMQTQSVALPTPIGRKKQEGEKISMQAEIAPSLYEAVEKERKKLKMTKREMIEYGLVAFLQQTNPQVAESFIKRLEAQG